MFNKSFFYKVFDNDNVFKFVLNSKDIKNRISITENINASQGELKLTLNKDLNYEGIELWNIIKVYLVDKNHKTPLLIYQGVCQTVIKKIDKLIELEYSFLPITYLLQKVIYKSWSSKDFNKTDEPANIIKNIIDYFNDIYTQEFFSYDTTNYGSNVNIDFKNANCFNALKTVLNNTNFFLFTQWNWTVLFKPFWSVASHIFLPREIKSFWYTETLDELVNKRYLEYKLWETADEDTTSINNNWLREVFASKKDLWDIQTAEEENENYLNKYKNSQVKITNLVINDKYKYIENIHPWDIIEIKWYKKDFLNLQVHKIKYNIDNINITVWEIKTLATEIIKN